MANLIRRITSSSGTPPTSPRNLIYAFKNTPSISTTLIYLLISISHSYMDSCSGERQRGQSCGAFPLLWRNCLQYSRRGLAVS